jgi:uncharacterized Zn finger protein
MNPPKDAEKARCMACQQEVDDVVIRPTKSGAWLLCTCPKCGVVWSPWPKPAAEPPSRP